MEFNSSPNAPNWVFYGAKTAGDFVLAPLTVLDPLTSTWASSLTDAVVTAATVVIENPVATVAGSVIGVAAVAAAPFTGGGSVLAAATLACY